MVTQSLAAPLYFDGPTGPAVPGGEGLDRCAFQAGQLVARPAEGDDDGSPSKVCIAGSAAGGMTGA